ncbi:MAG: DeoR/GlpR family DNA-binding transcription regulator [Spirochaetales bacterium]|nr:DeoR/GlpR family DNA-binding transcription regulator [Spirochaetales bacterium]
MLAEQRREKILELIRENGNVRVNYLSKLFSVSEPTIRQDLDKIEATGEIARDHGGAYLKNMQLSVSSLSLEHRENMDLKRKIGQKAAEYVRPGSSIIMDSGTTVTELASAIKGKKDLRIITNSLNIALILGAEPNMEVHMTGGEFKAPTLSLTGDRAASFFQNTHAQQLFLATAGVSVGGGLTYPGFSDIPVKKAMIESAEEVFLLADSTKINKTAFAALQALDQVDYLITDDGITEQQAAEFQRFGIKVITA